MRKIVSVLVVLGLSSAVAFGQKVKTKFYEVANYDKIEVGNVIDVRLVANGKEGVSVECDERLLPAIKVEKNGRELEIGLDWDEVKKLTGTRFWGQSISISDNVVKINGMKFEGGIKVIACIKEIKEIHTLSSGDVTWDGNLPTDELYLKASSSGDITWTGLLEVDNLHINCSSSGDVEGNYQGKEAVVQLSSSGDYEGTMNVETLEVKLSSSADFIGKVDAGKAVFELSSSGDAEVSGTIDNLFVEANSSADFYGKKIAYKYAEVETGSSANIYLSKSGELVDKTPKRSGVFVE